MSNNLDSDQARHIVGPDLGPNCLEMAQLFVGPDLGPNWKWPDFLLGLIWVQTVCKCHQQAKSEHVSNFVYMYTCL